MYIKLDESMIRFNLGVSKKGQLQQKNIKIQILQSLRGHMFFLKITMWLLSPPHPLTHFIEECSFLTRKRN